MLGTKIPEFWPIWKTLKHAVGDDKSYIHAKKVLVGIAKEKTKPEDIEFMEKVFSNIDELLWAAERRISERGREMCTDVASASVFSINAIILLMELAEKYGYNEQCENVIGEIATYPKMTFHTARECAKRFEPGGDELCEGDKLRNSALIRIATKLLEGPKWRETTAGIEFRLGKQETTKRGRAVAFAERVVQEIDEKTADLVLKRMAIAISFERKTGVRELFDRLLAKDGTIKDAAMHAIAMEMFG
ncbi:TPA: hypothetical protein HA238_02170, partial [Candidatus Micrarchaeota archaeon]|nr:hypothetical protein [Candidatus Micrarchaeota archaeon]